MFRCTSVNLHLVAGLIAGSIAMFPAAALGQNAVALTPSKMPRVGTIDERFQSYNIEMVEVTGGRFWAPYKHSDAAPATAPDAKVSTPPGMDPTLYRYRAPIDLSNPKLRKLATALGPAYVRVSGTWANSTYFQDSDDTAPTTPPTGFGGVLTRQQWHGVVDFSHAVDAKIVTSFAISAGVRDADGVWTSIEAKKFLAYTKSIGGSIAAAEMFNEPSFASMGGAPKGYDAAAYGRDFHAFHAFVSQAAPDMKVLGPGSVGESGGLGVPLSFSLIKSEDMLKAGGPGVDDFSYHFYGAVSTRCMQMGKAGQTTAEGALTNAWLSKTESDEAFYARVRDQFEPGKPMWLTETGEAACGGNAWAADFIDSFRYLNQLGALARRRVQVVMHNTLAAGDYALIDESTLNPRPNYWSAVLWRRLMGTTVLDAGSSATPGLYVYAHCLRDLPGGVALLAINANKTASRDLTLPTNSSRFTLTANNLMDTAVLLNGTELKLSPDGDLPTIAGAKAPAGKVSLAPVSISFFAIPGANNSSCR